MTLKTPDAPYRTASETVIAVMEEFSKCEPKGVVIIHTDEEGAVVITANINKCQAVGILETAKHMILRGDV